jgi:hypothetical protein
MKKILILAILLFPVSSFSQDFGNYLITNDIGNYKFRLKPTKRIYGNNGALVSTSHFYLDHDDVTYETEYILPSPLLGVEVQVTKHSGSDSDKRLLHEIEDGYRDDDKLNATVDTNVQMRMINGNNVYFSGIYGGKSYSWIANNNVVVDVGCSNCPNTQPEPLEIVQAYLAKFPSLITLTDNDFKSRAHSELWIKDEMDRRLWLCDKWFLQFILKKAEEKQVYQECVKSMNVFHDYREKYYSIKAIDEKNLLAGYLNSNNGTGIKTKLTEYKNWWSIHKSDVINL